MVAPVAIPSSTSTTVLPREIRHRPRTAISALAALELRELAAPSVLEIVLDEAEVAKQHLVVDGHAAERHCAERQLGIESRAELAHDDHIERRTERRGDFERNGHAAARQAEHDHVFAQPQLAQTLSELCAGDSCDHERSAFTQV